MVRERNVMFTETDFRILDSYKSALNGLTAYPGDRYEIVLYSLHDLDHSATKIINSHYTGRREGFPITDLALSMLIKIEEWPDTNCIAYSNRNQKGEPLKSVTIVICNHSRMAIGLLCTSFYMNTPVFQFLQNMTPSAAQIPGSPVEENYAENVDEPIVQVVTGASQKVQNDSAISNANKNKGVISILYQRGIFNLKDAVIKVAGLMDISKNMVYMHVRNLNHG